MIHAIHSRETRERGSIGRVPGVWDSGSCYHHLGSSRKSKPLDTLALSIYIVGTRRRGVIRSHAPRAQT